MGAVIEYITSLEAGFNLEALVRIEAVRASIQEEETLVNEIKLGLGRARAEGLAEGIEQGMEQGIEQGIERSQEEAVQRMLARKMRDNDVCAILQLSKRQLAAIKRKLRAQS